MLQRWIAVLVCAMAISGCAQLKVFEASGQGRAPEMLIASDLVNALMQVDGFHPASTRLQMRPPKHRFGKTLKRVLMSAGYDIQFVDARIGDRYVDYAYSNRRQSQRNNSQTYQLNVGQFSVKRDYVVTDGHTQPDSDLLVSGVDAENLKLNDHIFSIAKPAKDIPPVSDQGLSPNPSSTSLSSSLMLLVDGEERPRTFKVGESIEIMVKSPIDARISCYYQDPENNVMRIFPNRFVTESTMAAGDVVRIPATEYWSIQATKAGFAERVLCVSVHPTLDAAMSDFESFPDLEPMKVASLTELITNLTEVIGVPPTTQRLSIPVQ